MKIPFFDYPRIFHNHGSDIVAALEDVGRRGAYILQADLADFEERLAKLAGVEFAVGVGNATDGIEMIWSYLNLPKGGEVIVSAHTMVATATPIIQAGLVPVLCDVGDDGLMDLNLAESLINVNTVAISPTHLNGAVIDLKRLKHLKARYNLRIIEDAAQVLGALDRNFLSPGTCDIGGAISFYPAKVLGCLGDGGAIITNDPDLYAYCIAARNHGLDEYGRCRILGRNSRMDNLQAAILNKLLDHYDAMIVARQRIVNQYIDKLGSHPSIELSSAFLSPGKHAYQNFECNFELRDNLVEHLSILDIGTLRQWRGSMLDDHPALKNKIKVPEPLRQTRKLKEMSLMIPLNHMLRDSEIEYVCKNIINFYS